VGIHSDSDGDGEISLAAIPGEILVLDSADGDAAGLRGEGGVGGGGWRKWQPQIVRQRVCGPEGNDAQLGVGAYQSLQYIVNRAIAAAGEYGVAAFGYGLFGLVGRIRCGAGGCG
jgi:hypothetical protein